MFYTSGHIKRCAKKQYSMDKLAKLMEFVPEKYQSSFKETYYKILDEQTKELLKVRK